MLVVVLGYLGVGVKDGAVARAGGYFVGTAARGWYRG